MTCDIDTIVTAMVLGKLCEPELGKVPKDTSSNDRSVGCVRKVLIWERAIEQCRVLFRYSAVVRLEGSGGSIRAVGAVPEEIPCRVDGFCVAESCRHGLVYVQHVDFFVPRPWVALGGVGVIHNVAWSAI